MSLVWDRKKVGITLRDICNKLTNTEYQMKRRKLLLLYVLLSMSTHAQNILTAPLNMMRTDSLTLNNVSFIDTNGSGTDVVWDFSDLRISKEHHYALLRQDTLGVITREVDGKLERYTMKLDKLSQITGTSAA